MPPYRIVLADDHILIRHGIKRALEEIDEMQVIGETGDGLELLRLLNELPADMVILDISMPGLRGIEAIHEIKSAHPGLKVLVLTMHKQKDYFYQAISAGAEGYMVKDDSDMELPDAIEKIRRGGTYLSPTLFGEVTEDWIRAWRGEGKLLFEPEDLTVREREVLKLLAEGKSSREIADLFSISVRTVEHHRASISSKLGLKKTADLVRYAMNKGYV